MKRWLEIGRAKLNLFKQALLRWASCALFTGAPLSGPTGEDRA